MNKDSRLPVICSLIACALSIGVAHPTQGQLARPVQCGDCIGNWYYFDNDRDEGTMEDWACMRSTYDNHRGSDFSLRGGNGAIADGYAVIAAADGTVDRATDGFFDRCTACGGANCGTDFGFGYGNHVIVNHGDQRVVYAHMRMGSVRVSPGDSVTCGQVLGEIASSGCSTGAHLHFEVRPLGASSSQAYDPFLGMCSPVSRSSWNAQGTHRGMPAATCTAECPPGVGGTWTCDGDTRMRCVDADVMRQDCPFGCAVVGAEAQCSPPPGCPAGQGPDWSCDGDDRVRCIDGTSEREPCVRCDASMEIAVCRDDVDADGDGFGAAADCDDSNPDIYPGAPEPCDDGIDHDCSGVDAVCPPGGDAGINADSGPRADGGDEGTSLILEGGCGCSVARRRPPSALAALGLLLLVRRRSRAR